MWQSILKVDAINSARLGLEDDYKVHQFVTRTVGGTLDRSVSSREFAFLRRMLLTGESELWFQSLHRLRLKVGPMEIAPYFKDWEAFPVDGPPPGLYRFSVKLNSCYSNKGGTKRTARSSVESEVWFKGCMAEHGAEVVSFSEPESFPLVINHPDGQITVNIFQVKGKLEVKDSKAIMPALVAGIGKEKYVGLGMVVLS